MAKRVVLSSGLTEGSPQANAAEAAESARLDRELGLTPKRKAPVEPTGPTDAQRALRRVGLNLRGSVR